MEKPNEVKRQLDETTQLLKNNTNKLERDSHLDDIESRSAQLLFKFKYLSKGSKNIKKKRMYKCLQLYNEDLDV